MKTINISIDNAVMYPDQIVAGYAGDHLTTALSITLPEDWQGYAYRLLFKTSRHAYNDAYITNTLTAEDTGNGEMLIVFALPCAVMVEGKLQVQIRAEKTTGEIVHAAVMSLDVLRSIGTSETGDLPQHYVGLMENTMKHLLALGAWYPPKIVDGYWWAYDAATDDYANTNIQAQGVSGVYVGTDTPPDNANVWIDPSGEDSTDEIVHDVIDALPVYNGEVVYV